MDRQYRTPPLCYGIYLLTALNNNVVGGQRLGCNGSNDGGLNSLGTSKSLVVGSIPPTHRVVGVGCAHRDVSASPTPYNQQRISNSRRAATVEMAAKKRQTRDDLVMAIAESVGISRKRVRDLERYGLRQRAWLRSLRTYVGWIWPNLK